MWHQSKITYGYYDESGNYKNATEEYLHNAVSYGDVEAQLVEMHKTRLNVFDTPSIKREKFTDVIFNGSGNPIYKAKAEYDDGEKKQTITVLIPAESISDAEEQIRYYYRGSLVDYKVYDAKRTKIKGIYDPKNSMWTGDFFNRMDVLKEEGKATGTKKKKKEKQPELFDQP